MKVQNHSSKISSKEALEARIKEKFGKEAKIVKPKPKAVADTVEINSKKGVSHSSEDSFGDVSKNDPNSLETQEKLKELLKTGAFSFNERERKALSSILK